jgi:hypothetical protein
MFSFYVIYEGCVVESNGTAGKCSMSETSNSNLTKKQLILYFLLKITIYSMYSIQGKSYKIVPITSLTKMSTWTKSYKEGKIK